MNDAETPLQISIRGLGSRSIKDKRPLLDGSLRCTHRLNLRPVSKRSGGKVVARVGGLCGLLTRFRHRRSIYAVLHNDLPDVVG